MSNKEIEAPPGRGANTTLTNTNIGLKGNKGIVYRQCFGHYKQTKDCSSCLDNEDACKSNGGVMV